MCSPPSQFDSGSDGALTEEKLERVFREIEEASERRALEEEMSSDPGPLDPFVPPLPNVELTKKRRRQSISISRVGSYPDVPTELHRSASAVVSPAPGWVPPPLYRANSRTASTSSLASTASSFTSSNARRHEEENHTTQKETIAGRRNTLTKAMSSAFSKTLTRIRSRGALNELGPGDEAFVIGVAVHESTTEVEEVVGVADEPTGAGGTEASAEATTVKGGEAQRSGGTSKTEVGETPQLFETGASRRMSITVSAPQKEEQSRSRSGSINRLRGKLPLRGSQQTPQSEGKQQTAEDGPAMISVVEVSSTSGEGAKSPPPPVNGSGKQGKRLSFFAKALAARLRRKKSEEAKEVKEKEQKEKEKEKEKRGKHKSKNEETDSRNEGKSELDKEKTKQKFVPPTPIYTPPPSTLLDPAIVRVKSSTLPRPPPTTPGAIISEAAIPLPPSPHKSISAAQVPLPPSPLPPTGPERGAGTSTPSEPSMVPLPASPSTLAFNIPAVNVPNEGTSADSALRGTRAGDSSRELAESEDVVRVRVRVAGGERLPLSALPDADFGPMSEGEGEGEGDRDGEGERGRVLPTAGAPTPGPAEES